MAAAISFTATTFAQFEYMHSVGLNYLMYSRTVATTNYLDGVPMAEYSPRFNILAIGETGRFSVGSHVGLGFGFQGNAQTGTSGSFGFNVPLLAQVNFGKGSSKSTEAKPFGFYAEAGYTVASLNSTFSHGPTAGLGLRFDIGVPIELGAFYTKPLNIEGHIFGVRASYSFEELTRMIK